MTVMAYFVLSDTRLQQ